MKFRFSFIVLGIMILLSSCVVTQSLSFSDMSDSSSGASSSTLVASEFFSDVLEDLSCWNDTGDDDALMDVAVTGFARAVAASDFSDYVYIGKNGENSYSITFGFSDFNSLIKDMEQKETQDIIRLSEDGEHTTLSFDLSMNNYESLTKLIPLLSDPNFEAYGPVYNNPPYDNRSEEDYLYMMEFIFGEGARTIADSTITVLIDTPSPIISSTGTIVSEKSSAFEFRLMDFLLLHNPITFRCTY